MRKSSVLVKYNDVDATKEIRKVFESFTWTDYASGSADTISLSLNNMNGAWLKKGYLPLHSDSLKAWIRVTDWNRAGDNRSVFCGRFQVDKFTAGGPPDVFVLEGICIPINRGFNVTQRNKTYKKTSVRRIMVDIAKRAGLKLVYDANNYSIKEISQDGKSDMEFAYSVCDDYGLAMKIYNKKLVIYDLTRYEKKKKSYTIDVADLGESGAYSIEKNVSAKYDGVKMQYTGKGKKTVTYKYVLPGKKGNRMLFMSASADSHAEAERKAKAQLLKNLREVQVLTLTNLRGDPKYKAAECFELTGAGQLNGKYFIDNVTHSKDGRYTCSITAHLVATQIR